ncbi:hypothetical protein [Sigmofec virus UA08Rod_5342]|uniref:Uncharacterized protein n=1 Tax=Sigmofec virus UA08Rod_5342 TaxID=2929420 RepID=A0A976R8L3_9VIRU|nr:hypothetical protein [Sigmofec virus UA08Rod_5342]
MKENVVTHDYPKLLCMLSADSSSETCSYEILYCFVTADSPERVACKIVNGLVQEHMAFVDKLMSDPDVLKATCEYLHEVNFAHVMSTHTIKGLAEPSVNSESVANSEEV